MFSAVSKQRGLVSRFFLGAVVVSAFFTLNASAQNLNFEGQTGNFLNPTASVVASPAKGLGKPEVGYHFLAAGPYLGDHSTVSITEGFGKRFEFGFTTEIHADGTEYGNFNNNAALAPRPMSSTEASYFSPIWNYDFELIHAKVAIIHEHRLIPALSIGAVYRFNDQFEPNLSSFLVSNGYVIKSDGYGSDAKTTNVDVYLAGTKNIALIKSLPIHITGGIKGSNAVVGGLFGNSTEFHALGFGSLGFTAPLPFKAKITPTVEVAQQPNSPAIYSPAGYTGYNNAFDFPTTEAYSVRLVPTPKYKLSIDAGVLHAAGNVNNSNVTEGYFPNFSVRARAFFGVSYAF